MHGLPSIVVVYFIVAGVLTVSFLFVAIIRLRDQRHEGVSTETWPYETEPSPPTAAAATNHDAEPSLFRSAETTQYEAGSSLLTPAERSFFGVLRQALGSQYYICPKVRLADIIRPASQSSRSGWQTAFNRISAKHVDFAICSPNDLSVVGVIELDDRTHRRFERGFRDSTVDAALSGAGIRVIRVQASEYYSQPAVRDLVLNSLKRTAEPSASISSRGLPAGGKGARRQLTLNLAN